MAAPAKPAPGKGGEIQLTDALNAMAADEPVYAWRMEGRRYDIGNRLDYLKTTVEFALRREDCSAESKNHWTRCAKSVYNTL